MKQDLEDEVQVLDSSLEEAEKAKDRLQNKITQLEKEIKGSYDLQAKIEPLEKVLRTANREKSNLQSRIHLLEQEIRVADQDRESLQSKIKRLQEDLNTAQQAAEVNSHTPKAQKDLAAKLTSARSDLDALHTKLSEKALQISELQSKLQRAAREKETTLSTSRNESSLLRLQLTEKESELESLSLQLKQNMADKTRQHEKELSELQSLLKSTTLEVEDLQLRLSSRDTQIAQLENLTLQSRQALSQDKERRLRQQQADEQTQQLLLTKKQEASELKLQLEEREKRHTGEIKGLARQIQWLRAKLGREEGFRDNLAWGKRFMMLQVSMYGECNQADLRMLEDMGITPDQSFREKRHSLKSVGLVVVAGLRMTRMSGEWAASRKLHESLMKRLESMRRQGRRSAVR
ncbi:hypothetical protein LTS18_004985 [Coniosporium uncinatum]|uniref:Uncharacterized protein n=1 Tax=Coniosporium uncinatum TaxID=93489 RepID=A0ACC3DRL3_9PEZI|nr:hypothetical protein LTS18_004985 [Coniosporium uncinatum]